MGAMSSSPDTSIHSIQYVDKDIEVNCSEMQGWRNSMEDSHLCILDLLSFLTKEEEDFIRSSFPDSIIFNKSIKISLFGVFDGHSGKSSAHFCSKYLPRVLLESKFFHQGQFNKALYRCFHEIDLMLADPKYKDILDEFESIPNPNEKFKPTPPAAPAPPISEKGPKSTVDFIKFLETLKKVKAEKATENNENNNDNDEEKKDNENDLDNELDNISEEEKKEREEQKELEKELQNLKELEKKSSHEENINEELEDIDTLRDILENITQESTTISREGKYLSSISKKYNYKNNDDDKKLNKNNFFSSNLTIHDIDSNLFDPNDRISSESFLSNLPMNGPHMPINTLVRSGCTAVCGLLVTEEIEYDEKNQSKIENKKSRNRILYIANVGDSRAILSRSSSSIPLSVDHTPTQLKSELYRIYSAGGYVNLQGRVCGNLNLSRTVGDLTYKKIVDNSEFIEYYYPCMVETASANDFFPRFLRSSVEEYGITEHHPFDHDEEWEKYIITAKPDIRIIQLEDGLSTSSNSNFVACDEFLIFACDGLWEVYTHQEAVQFVRDGLKLGYSLEFINKALLQSAIAEKISDGSSDNMTVVLVNLLNNTNYSYSNPPTEFSSKYESLFEENRSKGSNLIKTFAEFIENRDRKEKEKLENDSKNSVEVDEGNKLSSEYKKEENYCDDMKNDFMDSDDKKNDFKYSDDNKSSNNLENNFKDSKLE